jgi:hypothetical protein
MSHCAYGINKVYFMKYFKKSKSPGADESDAVVINANLLHLFYHLIINSSEISPTYLILINYFAWLIRIIGPQADTKISSHNFLLMRCEMQTRHIFLRW